MTRLKSRFDRGREDERSSGIAYLAFSVAMASWLAAILLAPLIFLYSRGFGSAIIFLTLVTALLGAALAIPMGILSANIIARYHQSSRLSGLKGWLLVSMAIAAVPIFVIGQEIDWLTALIPAFAALTGAVTGWRLQRKIETKIAV